MSSATHAVDSKTAQRLRSRRLLVVDTDAARAEAFARALQANGASAVAVSVEDPKHAAAYALDPDAMLVNEDEPEPCQSLVIALRRHPRTRWATVLPISFAALWPTGAEQPDIAAIAEEVNRLAISLTELIVRARGRLPHDTVLEPLGPSRVLRALADTGRSLRVTLSDDRLRAEVELGEHRVGTVRVSIAGKDQRLSPVEALAAILAMSSGKLRIEERGETKQRGWNVSLSAALDAAALFGRPAASDNEPPASSGVRPAVSERLLAMQQLPPAPVGPNYAPTVPQITLSEVLAEAAAGESGMSATPEEMSAPPLHDVPVTLEDGPESNAAPAEPPIAQAHAAVRTRPRGARTRAFGIAFALVATSVLAYALYARVWVPRAAAHALNRKPLQTALAAPRPAPTPSDAPSSVEPEPSAVAAPATAAPEPREPSTSELKGARQITKRGHRYLRAGHDATAAAAYLKALALAPRYTPALAPLIRIYLDGGNAVEAQRWAQQLAAFEPQSPTSQQLLGDAYALSGDDALAVEAWRRASALGSDVAARRLARR